MRSSARHALAMTLLALPACELVDLTLIFGDVDYDPPVQAKLAISEDGDQIWVNRDHPSGELELVAFANPSGAELDAIGPFLDPFEIRDLAAAHETDSEDAVWTLHENGFRARWNSNGFLTDLDSPEPIETEFPDGDRNWCGLVMGMDGAAYLMAGHQVGIYTHWHLYREKAGVVTRTEGPFASVDCPDIAYDLAVDEVAVAVDGGFIGARDVYWFDPDTMNESHSVEIVVEPRAIAAFNHKVAVGSSAFIRIWDADGSVTDTEWGVDVADLDVQYGDNMVRLWWSGSGPNNSTVGWFRLD
ncbi:MAG: hypothetical protein AAF721_09330 [Myxococcota bacterium]